MGKVLEADIAIAANRLQIGMIPRALLPPTSCIQTFSSFPLDIWPESLRKFEECVSIGSRGKKAYHFWRRSHPSQ